MLLIRIAVAGREIIMLFGAENAREATFKNLSIILKQRGGGAPKMRRRPRIACLRHDNTCIREYCGRGG